MYYYYTEEQQLPPPYVWYIPEPHPAYFHYPPSPPYPIHSPPLIHAPPPAPSVVIPKSLPSPTTFPARPPRHARPAGPSHAPPTPTSPLTTSPLSPTTPTSPSTGRGVTPDRNRVDVAKIEKGEDTRTTIMLKNVPNKMSDKDLMRFIDAVCPRSYDFLYLRIDFANKCNVGYAFVNFVRVQDLLTFAKAKLGHKWNMFNSEKILQMSYANFQGKESLVEKFKNSCIMDEQEAWRPKIFYSAGPNQGLPEPFPAPNNPQRAKRSWEQRGEGLHTALRREGLHTAMRGEGGLHTREGLHTAHGRDSGLHTALGHTALREGALRHDQQQLGARAGAGTGGAGRRARPAPPPPQHVHA